MALIEVCLHLADRGPAGGERCPPADGVCLLGAPAPAEAAAPALQAVSQGSITSMRTIYAVSAHVYLPRYSLSTCKRGSIFVGTLTVLSEGRTYGKRQ